MVIKPFVDRVERDPRRAAGKAAERQMAHYLDRHFGAHKSIQVLHDVCLEFDGERAQIDHLVLHRYGVALVESKSVTTAVRITPSGAWERLERRGWTGMPDPLLQAERQSLVLGRLLQSRAASLLDTLAFGLLQGGFGGMATDAFAAVSDGGRIERSEPEQAPNALKADAVPGAIVARIERYKKMTRLWNLNPKDVRDAPRDFTDGEMLRVATFLRDHPAPRTAASTPESEDPPPAPRSEPPSSSPRQPSRPAEEPLPCKTCGGRDLEPRIGRFGPYGRCRACSQNTAVRRDCPSCRTTTRFERHPAGFAGTCASCGQMTVVRLVAPAPAD